MDSKEFLDMYQEIIDQSYPKKARKWAQGLPCVISIQYVGNEHNGYDVIRLQFDDGTFDLHTGGCMNNHYLSVV